MGVLTFLHRWVGVVLALFMLVWFSTGFVIAFIGAPSIGKAQLLAHAQSLAPEDGWLSLGAALANSAQARAGGGDDRAGGSRKNRGGDAAIADARLTRVAGAPVWLIETDEGRRSAISAIDGASVEFTPGQAEQIARDWAEGGAVAFVDTVDAPIGVRNADVGKPFHRVALNDGAGTRIIVSARTGEVVQVATQAERALIYAGAWTHLFRWLDALGAGDYRRDALSYAGFFAALGAATGVVLGVAKWKPGFFGRPTYARGRTQPYREFWFKYHFWAGLIGGAFALLWATSGFLSTNPGQMFSSSTATREELTRYRGGALPAVIADLKPMQAEGLGADDVELSWRRLGGEAMLFATRRDGARRAVTAPGVASHFEQSALLAATQRLAGETKLEGGEVLSDYDSYYYASHNQTAFERPLPVLRVDLADRRRTSLYIDPLDGRLLAKYDLSRRIYRWVYVAVHHWDFGVFRNPLVWKGWIGLWVSIGIVLGASAVVLAVRRLRRTVPRRADAKQAALATQRG
jgi:uncharacterized iron-regulated membrane protein